MSAVVARDVVEDGAELVVRQRVRGALVAGVDRERDAHHRAALVDERRARVARLQLRREDEHGPAGGRGPVDVGAAGVDLLGDAGRRRPERSAARVPVDRALGPGLAAPEPQRRRARGRRPRGPRGRDAGRSCTTRASSRSPLGRKTEVSRSPATTCAFVTMTLRATTKPVPSWIWSHASPSTRTTEPRTSSVDLGRQRGLRRRADLGRGLDRSTPRGTAPRPPCDRAPGATAAGRGRRPRSSPRSSSPPRPGPANPGALVSAGSSSQRNTSAPTAPTAAPAIRSLVCTTFAVDSRACTSAPTARPSAWPSRPSPTTNASTASSRPCGVALASAVMRSGISRIAMTSATARPAHDSARATKPSR